MSEHPWNRGFTLVEVIIVLFVMALLGRIVMPRIDLRRARVDSAVVQLSAHLLEAQKRAVLKQHDVRLVLDLDGDRIGIHEDVDNDGARSVGEGWTATDLAEGAIFGLPSMPPLRAGGATPVSFALGEGEGLPVLVFHRNGSASESGVVHLTAVGDGAAESTRAVEVHRATGRVMCWSYRTGEWREGC